MVEAAHENVMKGVVWARNTRSSWYGDSIRDAGGQVGSGVFVRFRHERALDALELIG